MTDRDPISAYKQSSLETAPPIKIIRLLYQSAIVRLEQAARLDPAVDGGRWNEAISKADAILAELRFALDHSASPELCGQLEALYLFCEDELGRAFGSRDASTLQPVIGILRNLLSAWEEVETQVENAA